MVIHLDPTITGHPLCEVNGLTGPEDSRFIQNTASPGIGWEEIPKRGNTVAPPTSTLLKYAMKVEIRSPMASEYTGFLLVGFL